MRPFQYLSLLQRDIAPLHQAVVTHTLFENIVDPTRLCCFMEQHVFAVWDFVCLLKTLYSKLAGTQVPWLPPEHTESIYLIGQIMSEEEADCFPDALTKGQTHCSHFEAYRRAMCECGANSKPIDNFLQCLQAGETLNKALRNAGVPPAARVFVESTFAFFDRPVHQIAASFVCGREGITGDLFKRLLQKNNTGQLRLTSSLVYYLQRHIDLDTDSHYPKALRMLTQLCGEDAQKWQEATQAALEALQARYDFWTGIHSTLPTPPLPEPFD
jgi:hypothetical protein